MFDEKVVGADAEVVVGGRRPSAEFVLHAYISLTFIQQQHRNRKSRVLANINNEADDKVEFIMLTFIHSSFIHTAKASQVAETRRS